MISITPTTCMNVEALTGKDLVANGLRYIVQSVSLLKNLSAPVMIGPTPSPILNAHHGNSSLLSKLAILPSTQKSGHIEIGYKRFQHARCACNLFPRRQSMLKDDMETGTLAPINS